MKYDLAGPSGNIHAVLATYRQFLKALGESKSGINNRCAELMRMPYADILEKITKDTHGSIVFYNSEDDSDE